MSRIRVIVDGSYVWQDIGPAAARTHAAIWATRNASVTGGWPLVGESERDRVNRISRESKARSLQAELSGDPRPNTPRCGAVMRLAAEPCARYANHGGGHRTRAALDYDAGL